MPRERPLPDSDFSPRDQDACRQLLYLGWTNEEIARYMAPSVDNGAGGHARALALVHDLLDQMLAHSRRPRDEQLAIAIDGYRQMLATQTLSPAQQLRVFQRIENLLRLDKPLPKRDAANADAEPPAPRVRPPRPPRPSDEAQDAARTESFNAMKRYIESKDKSRAASRAEPSQPPVECRGPAALSFLWHWPEQVLAIVVLLLLWGRAVMARAAARRRLLTWPSPLRPHFWQPFRIWPSLARCRLPSPFT